MESRFRVLGHGAHPIMIVFPLGLLTTSVIFDIVNLIWPDAQFTIAAYWMIVGGLIGGVVAAVPGLVDWLAIPQQTRAKRIGLYHAVGNDIVLILFAVSWWWRRSAPNHAPDRLALALSIIALLLSLVTGWLGGELVERLGVAVHPGAHFDAPSSLSNRPADEHE